MSKKNIIIVFTDGSCSSNGKKDAIGGIGIHFPNKELKDVSQIYKYGYCTNQKTELCAILVTLRYIKKKIGLRDKVIHIKTDSLYSINCITLWAKNWIKNGWITKNGSPVANKQFIEKIYTYFSKYNIIFDHVEAHTGLSNDESIGNARADQLAVRATKRAQDMKRKKNDNAFSGYLNIPENASFEIDFIRKQK